MKNKKPETFFSWRWIGSSLYNTFILIGVILVSFLAVRYIFFKVISVDSYLRTLQPYAFSQIDVKEVTSGLRGGRIPKPVYSQVWRDVQPLLSLIRAELMDVYWDSMEVVTGKPEPARIQRNIPTVRGPLIEKPKGASLLYVNSMCVELFGQESNLDTCSKELKIKCNIEISSWFQTGPADSTDVFNKLKTCLTGTFSKKSDFVTKFNLKIEEKENFVPRPPPGPKKGEKLFYFAMLVSLLVLIVFGAVKFYQAILGGLAAEELAKRMQALDASTIYLGVDHYKEEPDISELSIEFLTDFVEVPEEDMKSAEICVVPQMERPVLQLQDLLEDVSEFTDISQIDIEPGKTSEEEVEFEIADIVEEDSWLWEILVTELCVDIDEYLELSDVDDKGVPPSVPVCLHLDPKSLCQAFLVHELSVEIDEFLDQCDVDNGTLENVPVQLHLDPRALAHGVNIMEFTIEIDEFLNKCDVDNGSKEHGHLCLHMDSGSLVQAVNILEFAIEIDEFQNQCDVDNGTKEHGHICLHMEPGSLILAVLVWEIVTDEEHAGEFSVEKKPKDQFLNQEIQVDLMEKPRVGITTMRESDFSIGDPDDPSEDNIMVTGLTVDKDDPLKFVFWKKRLRDLREDLKKDALEKLKAQCPTLFNMGWFKENQPKPEEQIMAEDEELKKEGEVLLEQASNKGNIEKKIQSPKKPEVKKYK